MGFAMRRWKDFLHYYNVILMQGQITPMMKLYPALSFEEVVTEDMKVHFPGNYCVEQYYDVKSGNISLRLKFEDPEEETVWKLKWQ